MFFSRLLFDLIIILILKFEVLYRFTSAKILVFKLYLLVPVERVKIIKSLLSPIRKILFFNKPPFFICDNDLKVRIVYNIINILQTFLIYMNSYQKFLDIRTFLLLDISFNNTLSSIYAEIFFELIQLLEVRKVIALRKEDILRYGAPPYKLL